MRNVKMRKKTKKTLKVRKQREKEITMTATCNIVQTNFVVSRLGNAIYKQTQFTFRFAFGMINKWHSMYNHNPLSTVAEIRS